MNQKPFNFGSIYWQTDLGSKDIFLRLLFVVLLIGCRQKSLQLNELAFNGDDLKFVSIEAVRRQLPDCILQPDQILYKNGLIILTENGKETLIHLLDAGSLDYLYPKGVAGYGPGEIPSIWTLDSGPSDSTFWAYSLEGKTFNEYSLYNDHPLAIRQIKQSEDFFLAVGITWASHKSLMTYLASGEDKYVEFDLNGNRISSYGKWKGMIPGGYQDHLIADIHQGQIRSNLAKNKIVKAGIFRDRIEILDRESGCIIGVNGPLNVIPKFDVLGATGQEGAVMSKDFIIAFTDLSLSDSYVFALYSGKSDHQMMVSGPGETEIFVFDYKGNPIGLLKTDIPITRITSDKEGKRLFAITEEENSTIAVFMLPDFD